MNDLLIQKIHPDIDRALKAILSRVEALPDSLWCRRNPPAWSIGQVVLHLTLAAESGNGTFKKKIAGYSEKKAGFKARQNLKQRLSKMVVFTSGSIPFKAKAPAPVQPNENPNEIDKAELMARYEAAVGDTLRIVSLLPHGAHDHLFLPHFAFGDLTLTEWAKFVRIHAEHHSKQIDRLNKPEIG